MSQESEKSRIQKPEGDKAETTSTDFFLLACGLLTPVFCFS